MADFQTIASIVFVIALSLVLYLKRKNLETKQIVPHFIYFSMYRTKLGISLMDSWAKKHRKFVVYLGYFGIFIGFLAMAFISYTLVAGTLKLFTEPSAPPIIQPVLPFKAKGTFFIPFFYFIISIFIIAVVHEFLHGLIARAHNLKVKSSGFAFAGGGFRLGGLAIAVISLYIKISGGNISSFSFNLNSPDVWIIIGVVLIALSFVKSIAQKGYIPLLPAAFVEPDEKELRKRPHSQQLSVFAAGPLANIITGFVFFAIAVFVIAPIVEASIEADGIRVVDYVKNGEFPAKSAGIQIGEVIHEIDGRELDYMDNLSAALRAKKPGDTVDIKTDKGLYRMNLANNPENESLAYLGVYLEQEIRVKEGVKAKFGKFLPNAVAWLYELFIILVMLNFGIGLFNLVPIGPLDGGRMLQLAMHRLFEKEKGDKIWGFVGLFFLALIFVNLILGFVR